MSDKLNDKIKLEDLILRYEALRNDIGLRFSAREHAGDAEQVERFRKEISEQSEATASTLGVMNVGEAVGIDPSTVSKVDDDGRPANIHVAGARYDIAAAKALKAFPHFPAPMNERWRSLSESNRQLAERYWEGDD
jgi:hypothetical protein